jgi:protein O-mannosyl-transferase
VDSWSALAERYWAYALALLAIISALPHFATLSNELVFDDHLAIEQNPLTREPVDLAAHFTSGFWGEEYELTIATWRPLVTLSFAWNYAIHGLSPIGYHIVNLMLHALATVLLALLAVNWGAGHLTALVAGLLFAVLPVHVEAIAAGVGRADLMLACAAFGALHCWERRRLTAALVLLLLALLSKEMAVAVAGVMVWREVQLREYRFYWLMPLAVVVLWLVARYLALGTLLGPTPGLLENPLVEQSYLIRVWSAGEIAVRVLQLLVAPFVLLHDYGLATVTPAVLPGAVSLLGLSLLATGIGLIFWTAFRRPLVSVAMALFLGPYLLVSHLGPTLPMGMAERVLYLPSAGFCLLVAIGILALCRTPNTARIVLAVVVMAVVAMGFRSAVRVADWKDDLTLVLTDVQNAPDGVKMHVNAARLAADAGHREEAWRFIDRALQIAPGESLVHLSAVHLAVQDGNAQRALSHLESARQLSPGVAELAAARCAYLVRFRQLGAVEACTTAANAPLAEPHIWSLLGMALDQNGNLVEAESAFQESLALQIRPVADTLYNYGIFLARQNRYEEALIYLEQAARLSRGRPDIQRALSRIEQILNKLQ